jgi:hypothetical protein
MAEGLHTITLDKPVRRRVMFAVEFLDPVTRLAVAKGLRPSSKALAAPLLNRSRRFVWRLDDAPAKRPVHIDLEIDDKMYGPPAEPLDFVIEANDGTHPPAVFLHSFTLTTTSLYRPPAGVTAAVGRVLEGGGSREPVAGVEVVVEVSHDSHAGSFASRHVARTDERGEFSAALVGLTDEKLDHHPTEPGAVDAWLTLTNGGPSRARPPVRALRRGRLNYLAQPLLWDPDPP